MSDLEFTLMVLRDYGLNPPTVGKNIHCLFHEESRPSARIFKDGHYHCWSGNCGVHFSGGLGIIMYFENCTYPEAIKMAAERYGLQVQKQLKTNPHHLKGIEIAIINIVRRKKHPKFLNIYKTLDHLLDTKDADKLLKLHEKLLRGEI